MTEPKADVQTHWVEDKALRAWLQGIHDEQALAVAQAQRPLHELRARWQALCEEAERHVQLSLMIKGARLAELLAHMGRLERDPQGNPVLPQGAMLDCDPRAHTVTIRAPRAAKNEPVAAGGENAVQKTE